jgi:outer membrane protein assembly factor BamB
MKRLIQTKNPGTFALGSLTILCALAILSVGQLPIAAAQANWAQTYYNAAHTGYNPSETTLGVGNVSSLQLLWSTSVAGGVTAFVVDGGVVYATGQSNNLVALNASTGALKWTANTGGNNYSGPPNSPTIAVGGGLVFTECFFSAESGYSGICAYRASTGKRVWQWSDPCNCLPESGVSAPLVYADGQVYFGYAYGGTTHNLGLHAVEASSGAQLWIALQEDNNGWSVGGPAFAGNQVFVEGNSYGNGSTYALAPASGNTDWASPLTNPNNSAISVSGNVIYVSTEWNGAGAAVYALNATTGAALWSYTYGGENFFGAADAPSPPAVATNVVYFTGVDRNLYALHTKTGDLLWSNLPSTTGYGGFLGSPSVANGVVYVSGGALPVPNTSAYNAKTGALLWSSPSSPSTLITAPEIVNGVLYFASPGDSICQSICAYSVPAKMQNE